MPTHADHGDVVMRLRYGVNEGIGWRAFAEGPNREQVSAKLRTANTQIIRLFLFEKYSPSPVTEWSRFANSIEGVLRVGAIPMVTFARCPGPLDDSHAVASFAGQCADVVWGCIERWGADAVRDWLWCIGSEPNSEWANPGSTFERYREMYELVASRCLRWLGPCLGGRRAMIGGPAVDGFQPFWWDWLWRFVTQVDNSLIGFVSWQYFGDWRLSGEWGAPANQRTHEAVVMSHTTEYEVRASAVARLLRGRGMLNVCSKLNAHSYYDREFSPRFNQSVFGAAFYTSALLRLMRGGADVEMFWTGTDDTAGYGLMDGMGHPTPVFFAKALCAQHVRPGDWIRFPDVADCPDRGLDAVVARASSGQLSGVLVHLRDTCEAVRVSEVDPRLVGCERILKLDTGTNGSVVESASDGTVRFDGYGVAVVTTTNSRETVWSGRLV